MTDLNTRLIYWGWSYYSWQWFTCDFEIYLKGEINWQKVK